MSDILRKQIREKDAKIDQLLGRLNPPPSLATPMSIVPSKLALTPAHRAKHQAVLAWLERNRNSVKYKVDVSALEDGPVSDDDGEDDEEGADKKSILRQLNFTPGGSAPAGILASTALSCNRHQSPTPGSHATTDEDCRDLRVEGGIGSRSYFQPGPSTNLELRRLIVERQAAPEILLSGLINYEDAIKLFDIFFRTINYFVPILDENIHTPAAVLGRCPFLFTVVCALASRYYEEKPDIYVLAMHLAKAAAGNAFLGGWKTVEMCQAYLLLGSYSPPARRLEEDRSWFFTGLAFRLAMDLSLNRLPDDKPTAERSQREILNRTRTWLSCFILDRCICVNVGKPFMMPDDDIVRQAAKNMLNWKYHQPSDVFLVSLTELLRIITRFSETVNPVFEHQVNLREHCDLMTLHNIADAELNGWKRAAEERCSQVNPREDQVGRALQLSLVYSVFYYCRLVTFSVGLQQVIKQRALREDDIFFAGCLNAAYSVLEIMLNDLIPSGLIRCAPEHTFTLSAFATAVLIKFLRPQFASKLNHIQEDRIIDLVKRLLDALDAERQGLDEQHASRRYARFLKNLLKPHIEEVDARRHAQEVMVGHHHTYQPMDPPSTIAFQGSSLDAGLLQPQDPADNRALFQGLFQEEYASHSIWDDTLGTSSDQAAVPMPPILGFPDPAFLASMFSYAEQADPTHLF
ncbi:hypothetical protein EUX98_g1983 [Antrodiella citrinella]|uniref:Xylanolytic transcriptional activator regulatory domain-containing protein n=1 Tax=Antrodiella citrinella TaxID=2447956 RepID=A0A4S4N2Z2_9APHY|nr:hypothetical protein EUX98_g1983 [Antrodiella citrinella]